MSSREFWRAGPLFDSGNLFDVIVLVQAKRDRRAALKLMRKLTRKSGFAPRTIVTDELRSYAATYNAFNTRRYCIPVTEHRSRCNQAFMIWREAAGIAG